MSINEAVMPNGAKIKGSIHDKLIVVKIDEDPKNWERPVFKSNKIMQHEKMMFFQHKLKYDLLAAQQAQGLGVFTNEVNVTITIRTRKSLNDFNLEYVLKAILDSCNKHIINDDRLIRNVQIDVLKARSRETIDVVEIMIEDAVNGIRLTVSSTLMIQEKQIAFPYDIGEQNHYSQQQVDYQAHLKYTLTQVLRQFQTQLQGRKFDCHLRFDTTNLKQDTDNMMLMYLPVIREILMPMKDQLLSIGLYKRDTQKTKNKCTIINLLIN
ncbi:hypothetical protein GCM10009865_46580 [Aeromicrobium ponti]|uniref:Uncharacterized protein n=1 Tax=Cytobacillus oceanisediminis TaxID=665099 RepID=A0A562J4J8_9BACI|nr:RusA family crossover junction endodeoxyribonuclease [Cytobacillus oceanisediminis]TWH78101.1 hypothetical protein IQ19_05455 [Cytobacillus oceanisediminis]